MSFRTSDVHCTKSCSAVLFRSLSVVFAVLNTLFFRCAFFSSRLTLGAKQYAHLFTNSCRTSTGIARFRKIQHAKKD